MFPLHMASDMKDDNAMRIRHVLFCCSICLVIPAAVTAGDISTPGAPGGAASATVSAMTTVGVNNASQTFAPPPPGGVVALNGVTLTSSSDGAYNFEFAGNGAASFSTKSPFIAGAIAAYFGDS